ncbi:MAG: hypothetical protein NVS4B2_12200 [Chloroflexota bacterium]
MLYWYTGSAWKRVSPQVWSGTCLQATLTGSSSPSLGQLSGTIIAGALPTVTGVSPGTGVPAGGNTVIISGTGFTDSTGATSIQSVSFGGNAVPILPGQSSPGFTVLSGSSIEVWATPPGSGTVDITVTSPGGKSTPVVTDQFTYAPARSHQAIAIPSYINPTNGDAWNRIDAAAPAVGLTVINPSNGPGKTCDNAYAAQVLASQAHGIAVIGYVYTKYANTQLDYLVNPSGALDRTIDAVKSDINTYYSCYPSLDGIFFDEGSTDCSAASSYYSPLTAYVKTMSGRALTVINPGTQSNECYMGAADVLVTFEGNYSSYTAYSPAAWTRKYPGSRFWHMVYATPDIASMLNAVAFGKQNGAGWLYVTDGALPNPWGSLPSNPYWVDELQAVRPATPVVTSITPNNGPLGGGTPITINGTNFSGSSQVCFGTNCLPASAFSVNVTRTQITASAPAGSTGTVDVTVTTSQGTSTLASRDQFTYTNAPAPPGNAPLINGDFSQGISGWTPNCKSWSGQGYTEGTGCGQFYTISSAGIQMKPFGNGLPYEGVYQIVPATASSTLTGTVTVNSMDECGDASVDVSVTLLDAHQQPLGATMNSDPMFGNITFGHHPYTNCTVYVPVNTSTSYYQDVAGWKATMGTQQFSMNIGSLITNVPGITPSQVAYVKVQLTNYADTSSPTVTFGHLNLTTTTPGVSGTFVNVKDAGATGDGSTNDTAAFTSALNSLQTAGGGTLYVPPGTYLVQPSILIIRSNIKVMGLGATLKPSTNGYVLLEIQGSNISVSNISLDGNAMITRGLNIDDTSSHVTLSHDVVLNIRQSSDSSNTTDYYATPVGIQIYGNVDTVLLDGTTVDNVVADRPECSTCAQPGRVARGIRISPSGTQTIATNVTIQNSAVSNVGPKDDGDCLVAQDSNSPAAMTITHNYFTYCHKRAIKVQVPGVTISNNTIDNSFLDDNYTDPQYSYALGAFAFDMFAAISAYNSNITVTGNSIGGTGSFYNGIDVGTCSALSTLVVTNNSVHMGAESRTHGASLIRLSGPLDTVTVTGNTLDNAYAGILQVPSGSVTAATISGNTVTNVTYPSLTSAGPC